MHFSILFLQLFNIFVAFFFTFGMFYVSKYSPPTEWEKWDIVSTKITSKLSDAGYVVIRFYCDNARWKQYCHRQDKIDLLRYISFLLSILFFILLVSLLIVDVLIGGEIVRTIGGKNIFKMCFALPVITFVHYSLITIFYWVTNKFYERKHKKTLVHKKDEEEKK